MLNLLKRVFHSIPSPIVVALRPIAKKVRFKYFYELFYWKIGFKKYGVVLENERYEPIMLAMADEKNDSFLNDKIVADFGCGPRGSLSWAKSASLRIGIDVLSDRYADAFKDVIITHNMIYLKATEKVIPLPSDFVDVMYTLNAIDHVDDFPTMCREILRVLKPGGIFIGSFNIEERPTLWEPQTLNVKNIQKCLLDFLDIDSYRITRQGPDGDEYAPFFDNNLHYNQGEKGFLWARGRKKDY
jgi:SAM-dependent methyltransferase